MYFWFSLSCFTLVVNNVMMEPPKFRFTYITLGHSGFLIICKPNETIYENDSRRFFRIGHRVKGAKNPTYSFNNEGLWMAEKDQYKVDSLEQNTLYEIFIEQFTSVFRLHSPGNEIETEYLLEMKTKRKTNIKPAKPHFDWIKRSYLPERAVSLGWANSIRLNWFPCGRDRNCDGKEAGTHFVVKLRELDRRGHSEILIYKKDYIYTNIFKSGVLYEVVVISVNGDSESDPSNSQEIFLMPTFSAVTSVKVISYSNASILVSWKPPKYLLESEITYYEVGIAFSKNLGFKSDSKMAYIENTEVLLDKPRYQFKPGDTYTISITPRGDAGLGLEMQVEYTLPVNEGE